MNVIWLLTRAVLFLFRAIVNFGCTGNYSENKSSPPCIEQHSAISFLKDSYIILFHSNIKLTLEVIPLMSASHLSQHHTHFSSSTVYTVPYSNIFQTLYANVNHFFTLLGKMFFTPYGKEFFSYSGKQIFTS